MSFPVFLPLSPGYSHLQIFTVYAVLLHLLVISTIFLCQINIWILDYFYFLNTVHSFPCVTSLYCWINFIIQLEIYLSYASWERTMCTGSNWGFQGFKIFFNLFSAIAAPSAVRTPVRFPQTVWDYISYISQGRQWKCRPLGNTLASWVLPSQ